MVSISPTVTSVSAAQTKALGLKLATKLKGGEIIALTGHLGSGKTTFVKGLAKGLGVKETITSPTFVLMKVYNTKHKTIKQFVHIDCYRVPGLEITSIGLNDYVNRSDTVVVIEWADKLPKKIKFSWRLNFMVDKNKKTKRVIFIEHP